MPIYFLPIFVAAMMPYGWANGDGAVLVLDHDMPSQTRHIHIIGSGVWDSGVPFAIDKDVFPALEPAERAIWIGINPCSDHRFLRASASPRDVFLPLLLAVAVLDNRRQHRLRYRYKWGLRKVRQVIELRLACRIGMVAAGVQRHLVSRRRSCRQRSKDIHYAATIIFDCPAFSGASPGVKKKGPLRKPVVRHTRNRE